MDIKLKYERSDDGQLVDTQMLIMQVTLMTATLH